MISYHDDRADRSAEIANPLAIVLFSLLIMNPRHGIPSILPMSFPAFSSRREHQQSSELGWFMFTNLSSAIGELSLCAGSSD
jgi:hypothetical protein